MSEVVVELGDSVKDTITGFSGVVVAITTWMYGCRRIIVQPKKVGADGKPVDNQAFDEPQLKVTRRANVSDKTTEQRRKKGGPRPLPTKAEIKL